MLEPEETSDPARLVLYTDGACKGNGTGPGAVGGVGVYVENCPALSISQPLNAERFPATNQRAELQAVVLALRFAGKWVRASPECHRICIHTDSEYAKRGMEVWTHAWKRNGWVNNRKDPVANRDLWEEALYAFDTLTHGGRVTVQLFKVKGHSGNYGNDQADALASRACGECDDDESQRLPALAAPMRS
jgi:ribonuclease HI